MDNCWEQPRVSAVVLLDRSSHSFPHFPVQLQFEVVAVLDNSAVNLEWFCYRKQDHVNHKPIGRAHDNYVNIMSIKWLSVDVNPTTNDVLIHPNPTYNRIMNQKVFSMLFDSIKFYYTRNL